MLCEGSVCLCVSVEVGQHAHRRKYKSARSSSKGLSLNDPPQPVVPSPFYVNCLNTKKPLEYTDLSHIALQRKVSKHLQGRFHRQPKKSSWPIPCCSNVSICLTANKQTEQWRAPLTTGVANQRSPVAKLLNQVQKSSYLQQHTVDTDYSQKWLRWGDVKPTKWPTSDKHNVIKVWLFWTIWSKIYLCRDKLTTSY